MLQYYHTRDEIYAEMKNSPEKADEYISRLDAISESLLNIFRLRSFGGPGLTPQNILDPETKGDVSEFKFTSPLELGEGSNITKPEWEALGLSQAEYKQKKDEFINALLDPKSISVSTKDTSSGKTVFDYVLEKAEAAGIFSKDEDPESHAAVNNHLTTIALVEKAEKAELAKFANQPIAS